MFSNLIGLKIEAIKIRISKFVNLDFISFTASITLSRIDTSHLIIKVFLPYFFACLINSSASISDER